MKPIAPKKEIQNRGHHIAHLFEESTSIDGETNGCALIGPDPWAQLTAMVELYPTRNSQYNHIFSLKASDGSMVLDIGCAILGDDLYLECHLVTSAGKYTVRLPFEYLSEDKSNLMVLRYTGDRLDLFLDGVLMHQVGVADGTIGKCECFLPNGSPAGIVRIWDRCLEDSEVLEMVEVVSENAGLRKVGIIETRKQRYDRAIEIAEKSSLRPAYHFVPPAQWINDPNGMIYHKGEFHLFYQHNPHGPYWGTMHWGHARTRDFKDWDHLPFALEPELGMPDRDGCFSGVALEHEGKVSLFYTAVYPEVQCLATGSADLVEWKKKGTINGLVEKPYGSRTAGFRDPFIWGPGEDKIYRMIVGSGIREKGGALPLYTSGDLLNWEFHGSILEADCIDEGTVWECPNLVEYDSHSLLIYSAEGHGFVRALVGQVRNDRFEIEGSDLIDHGHHAYAPQVTRHPDGRVVLICWLTPGISESFHYEQQWAGCLSLPREIDVDGSGRLRQRPLRDLEILRKQPIQLSTDRPVSESPSVLFTSNQFELKGVAKGMDSGRTVIEVLASGGKGEGTQLVIDWDAGEAAIVREKSSCDPRVDRRESRVKLDAIDSGDGLDFHLFVDRSVVCVFLGGGRVVITTRVYPTGNENEVRVFSSGGTTQFHSLEGWELSGNNYTNLMK